MTKCLSHASVWLSSSYPLPEDRLSLDEEDLSILSSLAEACLRKSSVARTPPSSIPGKAPCAASGDAGLGGEADDDLSSISTRRASSSSPSLALKCLLRDSPVPLMIAIRKTTPSPFHSHVKLFAGGTGAGPVVQEYVYLRGNIPLILLELHFSRERERERLKLRNCLLMKGEHSVEDSGSILSQT